MTTSTHQRCRCVSVGKERGFSVFECEPYQHLFTLSNAFTSIRLKYNPITNVSIYTIDDGPQCIVEILYLMELAVLCSSKDHPYANALVAQIWDTEVMSHAKSAFTMHLMNDS